MSMIENNESRKRQTIQWISRIAIVTSFYVVFTLVCYPLSFGSTQFRISELLMLLVFFNRKYSISMILGCFIANLFSFNLIDCVIGTSATALACLAICFSRHLWISAFYPVITNALLVGFELSYFYQEPFWLCSLGVALGEFVCVTLLGGITFTILRKNKNLMKKLGANRNCVFDE
jgi:uncharacterized membrane protein